MLGTNKQRDAGGKSTETTAALLSQVNQLVTQGLRQAAIDLLEEAISDSPNNTSLLSALGRVYLLDRQPEKVVTYLRRSLAQSNSNPVHEDDYAPEALTEADAEYIDELAEGSSNDDFSPLDELDLGNPGKEGKGGEWSGTLHLNRRSSKRDEAKTKNGAEPQIRVTRKGRQRTDDPEPATSQEPEGETSSEDNPREFERSATDIDVEVPEMPEVIAPVCNANAHGSSESEPIYRPAEEPGPPRNQARSFADGNGETESVEEDLDLPEEPGSDLDIIDVDDDVEYDLDEIIPAIGLAEGNSLDDFESEDFGWEDLDDFEEDASRENEDEDLTLTGIPRGERARQAAVEVLDRVGWDREYLPLLETIFAESGWGAARIAIENQIERGAVPDQIALARQTRSIWFNNEHLWTTFRMKSNAPFMQAEAVYKNFSWADAMRLIRCFPSIPDELEIEAFIEEVFEEWYCCNRLRRHFHAFLKYLRYQIGASNRTLPGNLWGLFASPIQSEWGVDNPNLVSEISEMRAELREFGAESGFAMPGIENKFRILPEEAFDEKRDKK